MIATGENRTALYGTTGTTTGIEVQAIGHHPISFDVYIQFWSISSTN